MQAQARHNDVGPLGGISFLIGWCIALIPVIAIALLGGLAKAGRLRREQKRTLIESQSGAVVDVQQGEQASRVPMHPSFMDRTYDYRFDGAWTEVEPVGKGKAKIHFFIYPKRHAVLCIVFFKQATIRKALGARKTLGEFSLKEQNIRVVKATCVAEVERMLDDVKAKTPARPKAAMPKEIANLKTTQEPKPEVTTDTGSASVPELQQIAEQPKPKERARKRGLSKVRYSGKVLAFGPMRREDVPSPYDSYRLLIDDEQLQAEHALWGVDLQRAITDGQINVGERVSVGIVGETEVLVKGVPTAKKVWDIQRL